jgi:KaiC/GvpD/RAD55 family RecA-like ATPase
MIDIDLKKKPSTLKTQTLGDILKQPKIVREDILGGWFRERHLMLLYAPAGCGKSLLALSFAMAIAGGGELLGWKAPEARKVLLVDGELDLADLQERAGMLQKATGGSARALGGNLVVLSRQDQAFGTRFPDIATEEGRDELLRLVERTGADVVVLDNLSTLATVEDENAASSFNAFVEMLLSLKQAGKAVVLIHHSRKGAGGEGSYRGSQKLSVVFNSIMRLERLEDATGAAFTLHWEKFRELRSDGTSEPLEVRLQDGQWRHGVSEGRQVDRFLRLLRTGQYVNAEEIAEAMEVARATAYRLKAKAMGEGRLTENDWMNAIKGAKAARKTLQAALGDVDELDGLEDLLMQEGAQEAVAAI